MRSKTRTLGNELRMAVDRSMPGGGGDGGGDDDASGLRSRDLPRRRLLPNPAALRKAWNAMKPWESSTLT